MATPATDFTLHATTVREGTSFHQFRTAEGAIFQVRPGVPPSVAIDTAQMLLVSARDMANERIGDGKITPAQAHMIAFAISAATAIHSAIGLEV